METTTEATEAIELTKEQLSHNCIKKHMLGAMAVALIPVPGVDLAAVAGVQIKMLASMSKIYNVPFKENRAKNIIAGLVGSFGANAMATGLVASAVKIIPVFGQIGGAVALPLVAGAATYAVGKVFVQHFESGGTFLDFDPEKTREYFAQKLSEGQKVAADLREAGR
jgi:uncharacterized protein (DUF697 family)